MDHHRAVGVSGRGELILERELGLFQGREGIFEERALLHLPHLLGDFEVGGTGILGRLDGVFAALDALFGEMIARWIFCGLWILFNALFCSGDSC
jgi:hypothetical protein